MHKNHNEMMEQKEGFTSTRPDSHAVGSGNNLQILDSPNEEDVSISLTKSPMVCISPGSYGNIEPTNYLFKTSMHESATAFPTPDIPSLIKPDICEDARLLEAAKDGMTDAILQLIEEEGQQLHSHRDKVCIQYDLKEKVYINYILVYNIDI